MATDLRWNPITANIGSPGQSMSASAAGWAGLQKAAGNILDRQSQEERDKLASQLAQIKIDEAAQVQNERAQMDAAGKALLGLDTKVPVPGSSNVAEVQKQQALKDRLTKEAGVELTKAEVQKQQALKDRLTKEAGVELTKAEDVGSKYAEAVRQAEATAKEQGTPITRVPGTSYTRGGKFFDFMGRDEKAGLNRSTPAPVDYQAIYDRFYGTNDAGIKDIRPESVQVPAIKKVPPSTRDKTASELTRDKLDLVKRLADEGAISGSLALKLSTSLNKPKSTAEKEYERKLRETNEKIKQGYFKPKANTSKADSNFNTFSKALIKEAEGTGSESDVSGVLKYLEDNKEVLRTLSPDQLTAHLSQLKNKYGRESEWFTTTGWDEINNSDN